MLSKSELAIKNFISKNPEYYDCSSKNFHTFMYTAMERVRSQVAENQYVTILSLGLNALDVYAEEVKARKWEEDVSPFQLSYTVDGTDPSKIKVKRHWGDGVWTFNNLSKKVHVANVAYMNIEYDELYCCVITFIVADDAATVSEFMEAYHRARWQRNRHGACVLGYNGEKMDEFRKMQWEDIYLANNMITEIRGEIETFFKNRKAYEQLGLDWKRGLMLAGSPGNGKTAICRAIATTATVPVIYCALDNEDMFRILNRVEKTIRANAPCIVIFEDADTLGSNPALRSAMLNMLDGLFSSAGVLTIASTNSPEKLDEAFTGRPSRFDSFYVIGDPELHERLQILSRRLGPRAKKLPKKALHNLCKQMSGLSAACVQEIAVCSLLLSLKNGKPVSIEMLKTALEKMKKHLKNSEEGIQKTARGSIGFASIHDEDMEW